MGRGPGPPAPARIIRLAANDDDRGEELMAGAARWSATQKHVVTASYLAWMLDALDFFLLVFVIKDIAAEFKVGTPAISVAVTLTLAMRPIGAFLFGRLADRFGRRPVLMFNIAVFSLLSFATAFVPNLWTFMLVRALFGIGMGGVWGIGASLSMETIPASARGMVSGLLQSGYSSGYLIASIVFGLLYTHVGWRGLFMVGIVPAMMLIPYINANVPESPVFARVGKARVSILSVLAKHWRLTIYAILMMTAFNFFSHGTQDLYPTFLQKQHGLQPGAVGTIAIIYNIGAVLGCFMFGSLSQFFGRRRTMIASAMLAIPTIWMWAYSPNLVVLAVGAFLINFFVQGTWSVIPAYLNELSPAGARGTFPGTVYQIGNLFASSNLTIQTLIAARYGTYSFALASVALCAAVAISVFLVFAPEAHNAVMDRDDD
jgi:SHS family lactate transporter-like MFS transporter